MRKSIKIAFLLFPFFCVLTLILLLVLPAVLGYSGEFTTSQESDLAKYPELNAFVCKMRHFYGDVVDLEYGVFRFSYSSRETNPKMILQAIHEKALADDWRFISEGKYSRLYTKNLHRYPAQTHDDVVFVEYDAKTEIIHIVYE